MSDDDRYVVDDSDKIEGEELLEKFCRVALKDYMDEAKVRIPQEHVGTDVEYIMVILNQHASSICEMVAARSATFTRLLLRAYVGVYLDVAETDKIDEAFVNYLESELVPRAGIDPGTIKKMVDAYRKDRDAAHNALMDNILLHAPTIGRG